MITNELCVIKTAHFRADFYYFLPCDCIFLLLLLSCGREGILSCLFPSCLSQGLSTATKSRSFPTASSTTWPHFLICKSRHTSSFLLPALNRWACQVCTHVVHTHTYAHTNLVRQLESAADSGLSVVLFGGLHSSQNLPWSAAVLRLKQHTDAFTASSPCHVFETHRHKRADSAWSMEFPVWILVFNMVCVVVMWLGGSLYVQSPQRDIGGWWGKDAPLPDLAKGNCEISENSLRDFTVTFYF